MKRPFSIFFLSPRVVLATRPFFFFTLHVPFFKSPQKNRPMFAFYRDSKTVSGLYFPGTVALPTKSRSDFIQKKSIAFQTYMI
jgi:hypothetical protein